MKPLLLLLTTVMLVSPAHAEDRVLTVNGWMPASTLGRFLPHEHIMSSFGATEAQAAAYDRQAAFDTVFPYLSKVKSLGLATLADCTAAYFGRDPLLLKMLADSTGVHLVTNTGYYGAAGDRYVPKSAYEESADQIAARWVVEFEEGIDGTGIRPGFIKIGVDGPSLSEIDAKIVRAAAITHRQTGLTIAAHTGGHRVAVDQQLRILAEEGVDATAWVWVHAQNADNSDVLLRAAARGAWIELDAIREQTLDKQMACMVAKMFLALQTKALEKKLGREREVLHTARKEMGKASGKMKLLDAEEHQLQGKQKKINQKIDRYRKALNGYAEKEHKEKEKALAQQEMMKEANARR